MSKLSNFGFTKVNPNKKTKLVQKVFSDVADNYDLMNNIMSLGTHKLWKKRFVELINPQGLEKIIDVGSGSGDIARIILSMKFKGELHLIDLNNRMLEIAKKTIKKRNVYFHIQDAENLKFKDDIFDKYIISFCLRNITNIEKSVKEAKRVLKPGGAYYCLEFSNPGSVFTQNIYRKYKSFFLPLMGKLIAKNKSAYQYLHESIELFPTQEELKQKLIKNGFEQVSYIDLFDGIVSIHYGYKI